MMIHLLPAPSSAERMLWLSDCCPEPRRDPHWEHPHSMRGAEAKEPGKERERPASRIDTSATLRSRRRACAFKARHHSGLQTAAPNFCDEPCTSHMHGFAGDKGDILGNGGLPCGT